MRAKPMPYSNSRAATPLLAIISLISANGCGDRELATYPVTGTVKVDSKPAASAVVTFCPTTGPEELLRLRPRGATGAGGRYQLTTFDQDDGAPAGDYKVIIQWPARKSGDQNIGSGPDRLRGRYMNLERSQFTVKVEGATEAPPFELTSK
jgi:hypothetical protein